MIEGTFSTKEVWDCVHHGEEFTVIPLGDDRISVVRHKNGETHNYNSGIVVWRYHTELLSPTDYVAIAWFNSREAE